MRGRGVDVVVADALTVDWPELLGDHERWVMVANLPYNVATPVVLRALEEAPMIERFLVMVQREVGERLAAAPGTKAYGAVSVKVAYYADAEVVGTVPPTVFVPRPKVESGAGAAPAAARDRSRCADPERLFALVRAGLRDPAQDAAARARAPESTESSVRGRRASTGGARAETLALRAMGRLWPTHRRSERASTPSRS